MSLDTFAVISLVMALATLWFGEKQKAIVYIGVSVVFFGLTALRMGDELFYLGTGFLILILTVRMYRLGTGGIDAEDGED